jgi:TonB family protein
MRSQFVCTLCLIAAFPAFGQAPSGPPQSLPKDPRAVLAAAAPFYDFSDPALVPFHLKAAYQFYGANGKPGEQGTWEYWHISAKASRSSWARGDISETEWRTADGAVYRKQSGGSLRYFERYIADSILNPLPAKAMLDSEKYRLEAASVQAGSEALPCVLATPLMAGKGQAPVPSFPTGTRYCFDPFSHAMLAFASSTLGANYGKIVKTQNHYIPREIVEFAGGMKLFTVSIDAIDGVSTGDAALAPTPDAVLITPPVKQAGGADAGSGVAVGHLVKKVQPDYPETAKMERAQGTVVLAAVITKDGRINDLEVLASRSPLLAEAAMDAVKRWQYAPYLLNGEPVEVETTINVTFTLGH